MKIIKERLKQTFLKTIAINEVYQQEDEIIALVKSYAGEYGLSCKQDAFGNLICTYPGTGEPLLLNTHLDIPEPAPGIEYTATGDIIQSNGTTILGADPKSGLAVLLELMRYLSDNSIATRPIEFVFTLGEEAGLVGASNLDYQLIESKMGLVIDEDGPPTNLVKGAIGNYDIQVTVYGKTVHSRDWSEGVNAIAHVSKIIAGLKQGEIVPGVTFNIGVLQGGTASNSVAGEAQFWGEFRSFDMEAMEKAVDDVQQYCCDYARDAGIKVSFTKEKMFDSYQLKEDHQLFIRLAQTYQARGMEANFYDTFGGSDSNIFNANGVCTVAIGSGYYLPHQYDEYINLQDMENLLLFLAEFVKE